MVVLPAPVGPTMATVWPSETFAEKSLMTGLSGEYPKRTWSNSTLHRTCEVCAFGSSGATSSSSKKAKMRSAAAAICWSTLLTWVN